MVSFVKSNLAVENTPCCKPEGCSIPHKGRKNRFLGLDYCLVVVVLRLNADLRAGQILKVKMIPGPWLVNKFCPVLVQNTWI